MKTKVVTTSFAFVLACAIAQPVKASTITFEAYMNVPGYVPQDELRISNQFASSFGVTFGLDINGDGFADPGAFPRLERAGSYPGDKIAFVTSIRGKVRADVAKPGFEEQLGQFFLKGNGLIINYDNPVAGVSGEIWDIDGHPNNYNTHDEWWRIEALGQDYALGLDANDVIDSVISPRGIHPLNLNSLDGLPWQWSFKHDGVADIHGIRISSIGKAPAGFAFNNFSPSQPASKDIPEPSFTLGLLALGLLGACYKCKKA